MTPDQVIRQEKLRQGLERPGSVPTVDEVIASEKSRLANSASGSLYTMRDTQPERASKVISLSDRLGADRSFVDRNLEEMEETAAQQERDGILKRFPKVASFFSDVYRAAEAKDSVQSFAEIERLYAAREKRNRPRGWLEAPLTQTGDLGRTVAAVVPQFVGSVTRGIGDLTGGYVDFMRSGTDQVPGLREGLAAIDKSEAEIAPGAAQFAPQNYLRTAGQGASDLAEVIRPENMGVEDKVVDALGQIFIAVGTTAVTKNPSIMSGAFMGMGADQQGQAMRNAGLNPDEMLPQLAAGAGITGLSEQLRLGSIMRALPKEARERITSKVLARIAGQAGEEAVQETIEGLGQNLVTMGYDEEAKLLEGLGEQATVAGTASAIFQALVEVALPGKQRAARSEQAAQELSNVRELIESAPVFQRSRESVEEFLKSAGDGETILLNGDDVVELFQSDPEVFYQRMEEIGFTEDDISRAMDGHDIEVEAAKILSVSDGFEDWVRVAKVDAETPSLRELEREVEDSDALGSVDFQEAFERFSEQDEALEGFERVQSAVTDQLLVAGRGQAEAEAAGAVWGAMFRQLSDAGLDEAAVFDRLGLQVNPQGMVAPMRADNANFLDQTTLDYTEIDLKSGASVRSGQPVTFDYNHNTSSATVMFGIPDKDAPYGRGYEPSGKYVSVGKGAPGPDTEEGRLSLANPLVIKNNGLEWKKELSDQYGGLTGKELSKAIIADGFDGIITTDGIYVSEIVDFTSFDEVRALYQSDPMFSGARQERYTAEAEAKRAEALEAERIKVGDDAAMDYEARLRDAGWLSEGTGRTLNQLAGPRSKSANKKILRHAKKMARKKASRQEIWDATAEMGQPWYRDKNGDWITEIEDGTVVVNEAKGKVREVIEYPALYKEYPKIGKQRADTRDSVTVFEDTGDVDIPGIKGMYDPEPWAWQPHVRIAEAGANSREYTAVHELQHAIDVLEKRINTKEGAGYTAQPTERRAFNTMYRRLWTMEERIAVPPWKTEQEAINWFLGNRAEWGRKPKFAKDGTYDPFGVEQPDPLRKWIEDGEAEMDNAPMTRGERDIGSDPRKPELRGRTFLSLKEAERNLSAIDGLGVDPEKALTPNHMIDLDEPLSAQSERVRNVLRRMIVDERRMSALELPSNSELDALPGGRLVSALLEAVSKRVGPSRASEVFAKSIQDDQIYGGFYYSGGKRSQASYETLEQAESHLDDLYAQKSAVLNSKPVDEFKLDSINNELKPLDLELNRVESGEITEADALFNLSNGGGPQFKSVLIFDGLAPTVTRDASGALLQADGNTPRASVLIPGGGVLADQSVIVNLLKKSDRTSFMHESAHIFLELYAALEGENEIIAERMGAVRTWLKIEPGAEITRDQHEKFAESFEAYLMEGVAPSAELRSVFHVFRQWFVDTYRRLRGQLRNLEPEAKDIFDRMLASDTEIEMAQGQYVGTLSNIMQGIMTPETVEKYQKHARNAGNVARDKLFKKHMIEVKRREKKAYKEERGRVEDMARSQLMMWPEYKALTAFSEGGRSLDASLTPEGSKLSASENGEHPEIVAPEMGFTSADEMFKAVADALPFEKVVKATADKIMGDRYGDMLKDGSVESEAMEAVFNEPTIRMMEAERSALAEKAAGESIPLIAIRKEADRLINLMPIDQVIKPGRYAIKARDLHKKSIRSAARGKWDDALRYTHQAMLQHELARRAFKARDEIEKANRYLAKFAPNRKLDPKKINPDHIANIRTLMALPGEEGQATGRKELIDFAEAQAAEGWPVVLPFDVAMDRDLPRRRRMTMEQFREFRDAVKNLNKLGRLQSAAAQEQFNAEAQALADEIDGNFKGTRIRETRNPSFGERRAANVRQMDATIIRWPFLVESLQGGKAGKVVDSFDTRIRQALINRNARRQDMADKLAAVFRKHGITQSELNKRVSAPAIEAGGVKFEQIIAVAMNMGTEQNRDRLASDPSMLGDMAAIEAMLSEHLEQRHWDAAQDIWDLINTLWPDASAVERNATGVTPKKVEASSVQTKFGAYRGGYYPLKYDRAFLSNNDLQKKDEIEEWKKGVNGMATRASTPQGFLKERQENVERPLDLSLGVILSHIDDVTNDIYMREPASHVSRLLNKQRIRGAIKGTQGDEYLKTMETILKRTVTGTETPDTAFEKFLQTMRINASVAILGANVVTAGLAPISYVQTVIPQYGFKTVFAGVSEYYSNPVKSSKLITEKSAFMRERQDTMTREAHELIRKSAGQTQYAKVQGAGYWLMAVAEKHSVSGPLWVGVYNQAKSEGASEANAVTQADRAVSTTQGSGLEIDQSVMQGGNEGLRLLSFMWGYVSGYYGTVRNDVVSEQGLKKLMPLLKHIVILNLVASMMEAFIRGGFGDEEDPYVVAVWQMMMRNTFGLIPGVSSAVSKYDSGPAAFQVGTSLTRATENWAKAGAQLYEDGEAEGETVRRAMLETAKAGGFLFGVPGTVQAMKIEKTLAEDDDPTLYEAIVTGPDDEN